MFLPHELIIQILLRLPVKSLIRFKSVCKLWFSLISHDSHFANSHFQLTTNRRILLISPSESLSIDFEASLDDDSACVSLNPDSIFPQYFQNFYITGSCRGFILICCSLNIFIWQPSTGDHKHIPLSPFGSNLDAAYFYGFGYEDSTDDYLVVSMSQHGYSDDSPLHLEYFSLKANTWKVVEGLHSPYTLDDDPRESGDIIGSNDGVGLVKYDENGQFLEQHSYSNYDLSLQVTMYIDSMLSLPSDGDNEED
ncbi:F-box/kelch-repeat protein At3g06240-like isoform X3 [Vicia villosa]|uniref:F-box/kelch-repeat protein At3g06240-like isoform X3 n=1 Tax=Vicia villosa TaxID=3911 RepID=UPI00273C08DA|nr:F-box/kelch-repeat protein At3g06240-like isoform X3 [Vicia villosa]